MKAHENKSDITHCTFSWKFNGFKMDKWEVGKGERERERERGRERIKDTKNMVNSEKSSQ